MFIALLLTLRETSRLPRAIAVPPFILSARLSKIKYRGKCVKAKRAEASHRSNLLQPAPSFSRANRSYALAGGAFLRSFPDLRSRLSVRP